MPENKDYRLVVKTLYGLEEILSKELLALGGREIKKLNRAVSVVGDLGYVYKINLALRTGLRVLLPLAEFEMEDVEHYYEELLAIPWEEHFDVNTTFAVDVVGRNELLNHSSFAGLKAKDAIVDRFRDKVGDRPTVERGTPEVPIHIHIYQDTIRVYLDASGDSLHKRGYRHATNEAPISEVLAAGLILLSDWDRQSDFLDPMCGSGTILIEAAMIACNIPPSLHRKKFGFMNWLDFDADLWAKIKEVCMNKVSDFEARIIGCDRAFASVRKAQDNVKDAMLDDIIEIKRANFIRKPEPMPNGGTILFNPPYGERLTADTLELYSQIGDTFKKNYAGCSAWLITSDMEAVNHIHLKHTRRIKIFNGKLECRFLKYQMYEGSKKISKKKATD